MVIQEYSLLVVAVIGQYRLELAKLLGNSGVLVVMDMVHVLATDVITTEVLAVAVSTPRRFLPQEVVNIQYVLLASIDAVLENVLDVTDVHHM
jgi:hypothetical protein